MKITNNHNLPEAFVEAVRNDAYDPGRPVFLTASGFSQPPRQRVLMRRHADEISEDAMDRVWALFGSGVHAALERAEPSAITEERLYGKLGDFDISGQFDRLDLRNETLQDYKVTSAWSVIDGVKEDWITQMNVLRWLALGNDYAVEKLQIVAILRDWSSKRALEGGNYPQAPVVVLDVPVLENPEYYLLSICQRHADAEESLPECSESERWYSGDKFAVMKGKNKRATKVFTSEHDAVEFSKQDTKNFWIQFRPGENRRCDNYCPVKDFCSQYKQLKEAS